MSSKGIRFEIEGYAVTIALPAAISQGATMPLDDWLPFSPTEFRVIHLLLDSRPLSREEIATKLDEAADGRLRGILATLVGRHVLMTTQDGYRLNMQSTSVTAVRKFLEAFSDKWEPSGTDSPSTGMNGNGKGTPKE